MRNYNIVIVGVGGQGLLTLGSLIGSACIFSGLNATIAEVHGMAQRGGSVIVHVRIGREPSPIVPVGGADHIIALELLESARYAHYANKNTIFSINDFMWPPPLSNYPSREVIIQAFRDKGLRFYLYRANDLSTKIVGSPISANIAMLGFTIGVDTRLRNIIGLDSVEKALEETFSGRTLELNKKVLVEAYKEGLNSAGNE